MILVYTAESFVKAITMGSATEVLQGIYPKYPNQQEVNVARLVVLY